MTFSLVVSSFVAGLITFLAPCTLPLVPGYLAFISGVPLSDFNNPEKRVSLRGRVFWNGLAYVVGFSLVFILLGSLLGLGGSFLVQYKTVLSRLGGVFIIFFGLYMMGFFKIPFLASEKTFSLPSFLRPGRPVTSFLFGAVFAFGWTPCVGPVLGAVLTLAAVSSTVLQGALLLGVFSLGLAMPFLLIALMVGHSLDYLQRMARLFSFIQIVGGIFLILIGVLLLFNLLGVWVSYFFQILDVIHYDSLLQLL